MHTHQIFSRRAEKTEPEPCWDYEFYRAYHKKAAAEAKADQLRKIERKCKYYAELLAERYDTGSADYFLNPSWWGGE